MSDSQFSPEAPEDAARALRRVVPDSGDDNMVAAAHLEGSDDPTTGEPAALLSLVPSDLPPESDLITIEEHPQALGDTQAAIDHETFDDLQPMLDLRFPEAAQVVSDAGIGGGGDENRVELFEADRVGVTGVPDPGSEHEVAASLVEVPSDRPAVPLDASVEAPPIHHALDLTDPQVTSLGDPAHNTEASTGRTDTTSEVAEASAVVRDEPAFAATEQADDSPNAVTSGDGFPQPVPAEGDPTTLRIAAEADATAQALENLKRLLAHKLPDLAIEATSLAPNVSPIQPPPIQTAASAALDAPDFAYQNDVIEEFPLPPAVRERHGQKTRFALGSFLSGFAASWIFGAVLYAYLIFG